MSAPVFNSLSTDVSIGSLDPWTTLLTSTFDVVGGFVLALYTASGLRARIVQPNIGLRLLVDGAVVPPCGAEGSVNLVSSAFWSAGASAPLTLAPGEHTIALQWGDTDVPATIDAATLPQFENAVLYLEEIPTVGDGSPPTEPAPVYAVLATDQTAPPLATPSVLVTLAITTVAPTSQLLVIATLCAKNNGSNATCAARVWVDGAPYEAASQTLEAGETGACKVVACPTVAAGDHTVELRWASEGSAMQCLPVTAPDLTSARVMAQEKAA